MNFYRSTVKAKEQFKVYYLSSKFVQCATPALPALVKHPCGLYAGVA
jgi:hypothetical protein